LGKNPEKDLRELYEHRKLLIRCGEKYNLFFDQTHEIKMDREEGIYRWI
jgi:hypothetical protein